MTHIATFVNFCGLEVSETRLGTTRDKMLDPLGSVIGEYDDSQNVTGRTEYWPYGEIASETGTLLPSPLKFVGGLGYFRDRIATFLTYIRARWYYPWSTRWTTVDPLWPSESAYGSVKSNPINRTDMFGMQSVDPYWDPFSPYVKDPFAEGLVEVCERLEDCAICLKKLYTKYGKIFPGSTGKNNALRHCVGACAARRQCGKGCAWLIFGHEVKFWTPDSKIDQHNNHQGFEVADSKVTCFEGCNKLWEAGLLQPPAKSPKGRPIILGSSAGQGTGGGTVRWP